MRTSSLAALLGLGLSLVGCVGVVEPTDPTNGSNPNPGGGDDMPPPGGDDDVPPAPTPKLDSAIDKPTVAGTELGTTHEFKITLTASGDFAGAVTVTPTVEDATGAAITDWNLVVDQPSVTMPKNGTMTVTGTLKIPTDAAKLAGSVKFNVSSSLGTSDLVSTVTATRTVSLIVTQDPGTGQCLYPSPAVTNVLAGTNVRFVNMGPDTIIIHGQNGIPHQGDNGTPSNQAYSVDMNNAGVTGTWYCHAPGPDPGNLRIRVN